MTLCAEHQKIVSNSTQTSVRRNGALSIMVQIAGIDDPRNDDHFQVALLYTHDPMAKDAGGKVILGECTFRLTSDPH